MKFSEINKLELSKDQIALFIYCNKIHLPINGLFAVCDLSLTLAPGKIAILINLPLIKPPLTNVSGSLAKSLKFTETGKKIALSSL